MEYDDCSQKINTCPQLITETLFFQNLLLDILQRRELFRCFEKILIEKKDFRSHKFRARLKDGDEPHIMEPDAFRDILWLPIDRSEDYPLAPNVVAFLEQNKKLFSHKF